MTEAGHTVTPWEVMEDPRGRLVHVETALGNPSGAGRPVCSIPVKRKADAELIVRAVNSHAAMFEALKAAEVVMRHLLTTGTDETAQAQNAVRAALSQATGKE